MFFSNALFCFRRPFSTKIPSHEEVQRASSMWDAGALPHHPPTVSQLVPKPGLWGSRSGRNNQRGIPGAPLGKGRRKSRFAELCGKFRPPQIHGGAHGQGAQLGHGISNGWWGQSSRWLQLHQRREWFSDVAYFFVVSYWYQEYFAMYTSEYCRYLLLNISDVSYSNCEILSCIIECFCSFRIAFAS